MDKFIEHLTGGSGLNLGLGSFIVCLLTSFLFSFIAELMYVICYENRGTGSQIHRSFILIGPSVTLLFICIQLSLPLSLGLLGALSIIRFRTPIKEPEEIGFLMLVITAAIAVATFNFLFAAILYLLTFSVLIIKNGKLIKLRHIFGKHGVLMINLSNEEYNNNHEMLAKKLSEFCKKLRLESITTAEGTTSLQYSFSSAPVNLRWDMFLKELDEQIGANKINIFFSK